MIANLGNRSRGRVLAVQVLGELVDRDDPVRVEQQDREHGPLLTAAEPNRPRRRRYFQGPEDPKVQGHSADGNSPGQKPERSKRPAS